MVGGATEIQPPVPFLFKRRRPSPWNTCTTGAPSSSGRRRLRPVHQDRALSSTFLSDKSIRFKRLYIQIFEFRPLEFLKKLSRHPTPRENNLHPHDRKNTAVMGISIFTYGTSISREIIPGNRSPLSTASLPTTQRTNRCGCDPIQDPKKW